MYRVIKRLLDILCSFLGIVLLSPLLLILALLVKCTSKGPVLFRQKRVGKNKKYFEILKFRSMRADTPHDVPTHLLQNAESSITPVGHFLRKTSLDELPQLFNILMGQMSIVGPRPALWNQYDLIAERDRYGANNLTPGLTGWAQVNGRVAHSSQGGTGRVLCRPYQLSAGCLDFFQDHHQCLVRKGHCRGKTVLNKKTDAERKASVGFCLFFFVLFVAAADCINRHLPISGQ